MKTRVKKKDARKTQSHERNTKGAKKRVSKTGKIRQNKLKQGESTNLSLLDGSQG